MYIKMNLPGKMGIRIIPSFYSMFLKKKNEVHYIGGSEVLPPPLDAIDEAHYIQGLVNGEEESLKEARSMLIEHNLRLVVYIAKKFDNTGVGVEDLISIGTIGLIASGHAKEVVGVELNKDAVKDAILNAKENQIRNVRFFQGDAGEFMEAMAAEGNSMDVLFMDPPRAGSDEKFMASAVKMGPEKIVYISCNPETLARDLKYLTKKGYQVKKIQPVEMFAFTEHVETVCLLSKKCPV